MIGRTALNPQWGKVRICTWSCEVRGRVKCLWGGCSSGEALGDEFTHVDEAERGTSTIHEVATEYLGKMMRARYRET